MVMKYGVTGASGRLGRLVLCKILEQIPHDRIVALTRNPSKLSDLARQGVAVRYADFDRPETVRQALVGVERLLLISADELGKRERQHVTVIEAAKESGVTFIAYTSVLHADTCTINLAGEHRATEVALQESGLNHAILRHGWYMENILSSAQQHLATGHILGCSGQGRQSAATRADFAAGDAAVLLDPTIITGTFELAGDYGFTMDEYAATLADVTGSPVRYVDLSEHDYGSRLVAAGRPERFASMIAHASAKCADNVMFDGSGTLSKLIGRPTVPLRDAIVATLDL
ncbi:hypothetical protein ANO11243_056320 [Dothideomycetidae sp. 11243]|nr:hypothetical protein ANO11243_056320 [fungal sp. No.11243]